MDPARSRPPIGLYFIQPGGLPNNVIGRHAGSDISLLSIGFGRAAQNRLAQRFHRFRRLQVITFALQSLQRVVQRCKDIQIRCGSGRARIGREPKEHDGQLTVLWFRPAQPGQAIDPRSQHLNPFRGRGHRLGGMIGLAIRCHPFAMPTGKNRGHGGTVQLRQGDEHRSLDGPQALR